MTRSSRADYLGEVAELLWPAPLRWELSRRPSRANGAVVQEFVVIPSARTPRMLVPTRPRLAAAALRNSQSGSGSRERLRALALATAFRLHLGRVVFRDRLRVWSPDGRRPTPDTSLKAHLDAVTGTDGSWALPVTRARANRKPVLQVLDPRARPVAFVKVGTNALTRALVRAEERSLDSVQGCLATTAVPGVIASTDWGELSLLALSPLPLARRSASAPPERVTVAALEIMRVGGSRVLPLRDADYWTRLRERIAGLEDARGAMLLSAWQRLDELAGLVEVEIGAWHGDWAPWNMAWVDGELLVWDFERFERGVPVGFDLVHADLQTRILDPSRSAEALILDRLEHAPALLRAAGVSTTTSYVVFTAYLLEIGCRWLGDRQGEAGGWNTELDDIIRCADTAAVRAGNRHAQ